MEPTLHTTSSSPPSSLMSLRNILISHLKDKKPHVLSSLAPTYCSGPVNYQDKDELCGEDSVSGFQLNSSWQNRGTSWLLPDLFLCFNLLVSWSHFYTKFLSIYNGRKPSQLPTNNYLSLISRSDGFCNWYQTEGKHKSQSDRSTGSLCQDQY